MTLRPAAPDSGIVFRRADVGGATARARHDTVRDTTMGTSLAVGGGARVATVEHLMAAFAGLAIDNVEVALDGPEVPIMDGSAAPFVALIERAGVVEQDVPRRAIKVLKPVVVSDGARGIAIAPYDGFAVRIAIDFDHPAIGVQSAAIDFDDGSFARDLADARTFGFAGDAKALRDRGLALGASLDNTVVLDGDGVLNRDGLRHADEFARHKVLDCIGDLYLAGAPLLGRVNGVCSSHKLNHRLLLALFADPSAWREARLDDRSIATAFPGQAAAMA